MDASRWLHLSVGGWAQGLELQFERPDALPCGAPTMVRANAELGCLERIVTTPEVGGSAPATASASNAWPVYVNRVTLTLAHDPPRRDAPNPIQVSLQVSPCDNRRVPESLRTRGRVALAH